MLSRGMAGWTQTWKEGGGGGSEHFLLLLMNHDLPQRKQSDGEKEHL